MVVAGKECADVVVIGAGAAGLACAADLAACGLAVRLLEADEAPGGRMRTDRVAGFTVDRGFQVFNTSYPQVKHRLDLRRLRLRRFNPAVLVSTTRGMRRYTDPTRDLRGSGDLLSGRAASPRDLLAVGALSARDMLEPAALLRARPDTTTHIALTEAGVSQDLIETFFRPFLSGVFLEEELDTSSRVFHLVWRTFLRGTLCLPADGIQAVPAQLASQLPYGVLSTEARVDRLTDDGVQFADGAEIHARAVVVATGARAAAHLVTGLHVSTGRTVSTIYHAAERSPLAEPTLVVDAGRRFLNTCVLTEVHPGFATDGRALVSTSVLGELSPERDDRIREALAEVYGVDTKSWETVRQITVPDALPAMPPPYPLTRTTRLSAGRYVCGDHRATGSLQGALASGARAAREVLADLEHGRTRTGSRSW
ncbi:NAD(P)/FAD-dependent oxidoreductase [Streptomyces sp. NPDC017868]|uniref:NAD(P)/FAD-dependent oxidoreductase n=1 Tax=Streptomyces sp. NPDC017868 TaxID=3365014 RepID=UPI00378F6352